MFIRYHCEAKTLGYTMNYTYVHYRVIKLKNWFLPQRDIKSSQKIQKCFSIFFSNNHILVDEWDGVHGDYLNPRTCTRCFFGQLQPASWYQDYQDFLVVYWRPMSSQLTFSSRLGFSLFDIYTIHILVIQCLNLDANSFVS